jgi:hypothetical protein
MQFLSVRVVAMSVVVAVTRPRIPLLVATFVGVVAMFVGVVSIMAAIAAIAARDSYSGHHYHNRGGGFVDHHFGYLTLGISVGLAQDHKMGDTYVDFLREAT